MQSFRLTPPLQWLGCLLLTAAAYAGAQGFTQGACDTVKETVDEVVARLSPAIAGDELKDLFQRLKYVTNECPSHGDAWFYRACIERKLGRPAAEVDMSMKRALQYRSSALGRGIDPLASSAKPDGATQPTLGTGANDSAPQIEITSPSVPRGQGARVKTCQTVVRGQAIDRSAIRELKINGARAEVDAQGYFSANISLRAGDNAVTVTATNEGGKTASRDFKIVCENQPASTTIAANSAPSPPLPAATKQYALVIGINNYQHLSKLNTAVTDAQEVARVLREDYGFEVRLLTDASREDIIKALNAYQQILDEQSRLLIYYAGHGTFDKDGEKAYWLPVNADRNEDLYWIMADEVTVKLKRIPARHVLIISDSCYSGTMSRATVTGLTTPAERNRYLLKSDNGKSRMLMASGGNEPVSDGGGGKHSVFASALLRGLREIKDNVFTAEELFHNFILQPVTGRSDQKPEYNQIRNSGHDGGDFIFVRLR